MRVVRLCVAGWIVIAMCLSASRAAASPATLALLAQIHRVFAKTNPRIAQVHMIDVIDDASSPGHRYAALATGVARSPAGTRDELFGVFVLDSTLTRIEKTIEVLPSGRLLDYMVSISFPSADTLLVSGGTADGAAALRHAHAWSR